MPKFIYAIIALAFCLIGSQAVADDAWRRYETANFILYSDLDQDLSMAHAVQLEQYQFILSDYFAIPYDGLQGRKQEIYLLGREYQFTQTMPSLGNGVLGYMKMCEQGVGAFALSMGEKMPKYAMASKRQNLGQIIVFHEYAHDFMFRNISQVVPSWYVEGFAEYFSTIAFEGDRLVVGLSAAFRGYDLENIQRWPPYADLLTYNKGPSIKRADYFHARSWLLTHYILSHPDLRLRLNDYLAAYHAGEDPIDSFERIMGIKVKDLDRMLRVYARNLQATVYRLNTMPPSDVDVTVLPPSSEKLLLWDAAVKTCPSDDYKPRLIKQIRTEAAAHEPTSFSRLVLARAETVIGDKATAIELLKSYTQDFPEDAEGWSLLGQAWYLQSKEDGADGKKSRAEARSALSKAYKMKPEEPRTLFYLSLAQENDGQPSTTALNAALQAYYLSPSVFEYAKRASMALIASDRVSDGRAILLPMSSSAHRTRTTVWINMVIEAIDDGKSREEVLALFDIEIKNLPDPDKTK